MHSIKKRFEFDAGHRLSKHDGKCRNIHGHRYAVEVHIESGTLNNDFMVLDFSDLKFVKDWLDDNWDHGMILNRDDLEVVKFCVLRKFKYYQMEGDPTAENMAEHLCSIVDRQLEQAGVDICVARIVVHETPSCSATYENPNNA